MNFDGVMTMSCLSDQSKVSITVTGGEGDAFGATRVKK
jgi:hypothetical protein